MGKKAKFEMSLNELLIIAMVCMVVCKPQDIKLIIKTFLRIKAYLLELKEEVTMPIKQEMEKIQQEDLLDPKTIAEINLYIEKINQLGQNYQGPYDLLDIKKYYYQLITKQNNNFSDKT